LASPIEVGIKYFKLYDVKWDSGKWDSGLHRGAVPAAAKKQQPAHHAARFGEKLNKTILISCLAQTLYYETELMAGI
jgi:hypothetical protein